HTLDPSGIIFKTWGKLTSPDLHFSITNIHCLEPIFSPPYSSLPFGHHFHLQHCSTTGPIINPYTLSSPSIFTHCHSHPQTPRNYTTITHYTDHPHPVITFIHMHQSP
ncbi:hypothetical protein VIGAN_05244200, partial [Vigna angularis var. angularis]